MKRINFEELHCIELVAVNLYKATPSDYPMKNYGRKSCGMLYTYKGSETYHFGDRALTASENTVTLLPKGEKYYIDFEGKESSVIAFEFELPEGQLFQPFKISLGEINPLSSIFAESEKNWKRHSTGYYQECLSDFFKVVAFLAKNEKNYVGKNGQERLDGALRYIHEHYTEKELKTEELCLLSNMHPSYFRILFKKIYGMAPKDYVMTLKMERAKELMRGEKYSLSRIAELLGFCDVYHFSKAFKKKTGLSPSDFRKGD